MRIRTSKPDKAVIRIDADRNVGDPLWILLRSDAHHDNSHTDLGMERRHLDEALSREALILDGGDCACAMQGKWDRRADRSALRPEYQFGNYFDCIVNEAVRFYAPYARNWVMMGLGNHETAILKHHETNLTERLVHALREAGAEHLQYGGYAGWVRVVIKSPSREKRQNSLWIYRHHGYGGGGPVTRGVIQTARMGLYLPDADIVWTGHTHDHWLMPIERYRINKMDRPYLDRQMHVRTAGYKDEFTPQNGWHIERGGPPKPRGAAWLKCWLTDTSTIRYEITEAI